MSMNHRVWNKLACGIQSIHLEIDRDKCEDMPTSVGQLEKIRMSKISTPMGEKNRFFFNNPFATSILEK